MDETQQFPQEIPTAPFPAPPPFWKHFTTSNIERLKELEAQDDVKPKDLSFEIACLRPPPPPPPEAESYLTFLQAQSLTPSVPPLPPDDVLLFDPRKPDLDHAALLHQFTNSLLLNFLELSTVLGNAPRDQEAKMDDLRKLMLNVHTVINMYRPHQAREGVREMLQARLKDGEEEIEKAEIMKEKVERFLKRVEEENVVREKEQSGESKGVNGVRTISKEMEQARNLWATINELSFDEHD